MPKYLINDYACPKCGLRLERMEEEGVDVVQVPCSRQCNTLCQLTKCLAAPSFKIDVESHKFVPTHVRRARNLGHGGANAATEGRYDDDDPKAYQKKIQVGPGS